MMIHTENTKKASSDAFFYLKPLKNIFFYEKKPKII
jgi:hypothetical protein